MKLPTRPVARRTLLVLPGSLAALLFLPRRRAEVAPAPIGLSEFLTLSTRLTGKTELDPEVANIYLTALAASPNQRQRIADLAHGRQSHPDLEREIILTWYTGICKPGGRDRLATYRGAIMWRTLGIPAPGTCGGTTGFWAQPPSETR